MRWGAAPRGPRAGEGRSGWSRRRGPAARTRTAMPRRRAPPGHARVTPPTASAEIPLAPLLLLDWHAFRLHSGCASLFDSVCLSFCLYVFCLFPFFRPSFPPALARSLALALSLHCMREFSLTHCQYPGRCTLACCARRASSVRPEVAPSTMTPSIGSMAMASLPSAGPGAPPRAAGATLVLYTRPCGRKPERSKNAERSECRSVA